MDYLKTNKIRITKDLVIFSTIGYSLLTIFAIACLVPFVVLISASFSSQHSIAYYGFGLLPKEWSLEGYKALFKNPIDIFRSYLVTIFITAVGCAFGLFLTSMMAFVMSRKDFAYRNKFAFYFYFTTLFNGGLVSTYIVMIRNYHLQDNLLSLILPALVNVFYLIVLRSFMISIPDSLCESAKIDGANDFKIFLSIILPLSKPALATIGLFLALDYWNGWYHAMLYITNYKLYPLQYMLYDMISNANALSRIAQETGVVTANIPIEPLKMAMAVVATGPIILLYPFVQKYFIKGITVGAVKG